MRKNYKKRNKINTINKLFIVFFLNVLVSIGLFNVYGSNVSKKGIELINAKIDSILYDYFSSLVNRKVINNSSINGILNITKNNEGEILTVNYDIEKSYKLLWNISSILKKGIEDLENGTIDVDSSDKYLTSGPHGLIISIPLFLNSPNMFINNLGPKIPAQVNFNETLLTNIKIKVTNYGLNNALLEVYISVEMQKLIITPVRNFDDKFRYDILIAA